MEKMFVYPESLDSSLVTGLMVNEVENPRSKAGIVSYRCKLYRTLLEQGIASRRVGLAWSDHVQATDGADA